MEDRGRMPFAPTKHYIWRLCVSPEKAKWNYLKQESGVSPSVFQWGRNVILPELLTINS
jgi:hypothetical protein